MKQYFIGQGTGIVKDFDTLEEMLEYHSKMEDLDKHFCKLYDREHNKMADGNDILFNRGWREWGNCGTTNTLKPMSMSDLCTHLRKRDGNKAMPNSVLKVFDAIINSGFVIGQNDSEHNWYSKLSTYEEFAPIMEKYVEMTFIGSHSQPVLTDEDVDKTLHEMFNILSDNQLAVFKLKKECKTYKEKATEMLQSALKMQKRDAKNILDLIIKEGGYKPCVFPLLNAPESLEDWNEIRDVESV